MHDSFAIQINRETTNFTSDLSVDHNLTAENHIGNEFDAVILKKRRQSYTISKKREMIELIQTAERSNIKNPIAYIAKESEIDRKILAKWIKEKNTLNNLELVGSARKIHQGPPLKYELQEKEVLDRVKHGFLYYEKSSWCFFKVFRLSKLIL
jgi:transposase-like protein